MPALRKVREERGTHFVGDASGIKSLAHRQEADGLSRCVLPKRPPAAEADVLEPSWHALKRRALIRTFFKLHDHGTESRSTKRAWNPFFPIVQDGSIRILK